MNTHLKSTMWMYFQHFSICSTSHIRMWLPNRKTKWLIVIGWQRPFDKCLNSGSHLPVKGLKFIDELCFSKKINIMAFQIIQNKEDDYIHGIRFCKGSKVAIVIVVRQCVGMCRIDPFEWLYIITFGPIEVYIMYFNCFMAFSTKWMSFVGVNKLWRHAIWRSTNWSTS